MPPFRMYLVLSVIFFVVAFFDPKDDFNLFFEPESETVPEEVAEDTESASNGIFDNCENASIASDEDLPAWIKRRFTDERVQRICERNQARGTDNFAAAIVDNVPVALIVLLPLMAMVLKALYPLSRRYFVEHLLFVVHFHAFFFLILTLQILFDRTVSLISLDGVISTLVIVALSFYIPVYLYKAMRRVYDQGHMVTIGKYIVLLFAYFAGATLTLLGAFSVAILSA